MDPQNQWQFPLKGADAEFRWPDSSKHQSYDGQKPVSDAMPWEQPRQPGVRGGAVASRAHERAQEVLRAEREQQQFQRVGGDHPFGGHAPLGVRWPA